MAITSVRPNTPVSTPIVTPDKPAGTTPGSTTLPPNTADTGADAAVPAPGTTSAAMMTKFMNSMAMNMVRDSEAEQKQKDEEALDDAKEEDARNGIE